MSNIIEGARGGRGAMGNGGIGGSGLFGFIGTSIRCDAKDNSMNCTLAKIVSTIMMLFILGFILYMVYSFIPKGVKKGGGMSLYKSGGYRARK